MKMPSSFREEEGLLALVEEDHEVAVRAMAVTEGPRGKISHAGSRGTRP